MTVGEIRELNDDALWELSMKKQPNGNATSEAKIAQRIICERSGIEIKAKTSSEKSLKFDGCDNFDCEHGWYHNREE